MLRRAGEPMETEGAGSKLMEQMISVKMSCPNKSAEVLF